MSNTLKDSPNQHEQVSLGFDLEDDQPSDPTPAKEETPKAEAAAPKAAAAPKIKKAETTEGQPAEAAPVPKHEAPVAAKPEAATPPPAAEATDAAESNSDESSDADGSDGSDGDDEPQVIKTVELGNTTEGAWMTLSDGTRQELDEKAWRKELKRLFSKEVAGDD